MIKSIPWKKFLPTLSIFITFFVCILLLGNTLKPLLFSAVIAYLFFPIITKLEKLNIHRKYTIFSIIILIAIMISIILLIALPYILKETSYFISSFPNYLEKFINILENFSINLGLPIIINKTFIINLLTEHMSKIPIDALGGLTSKLHELLKDFLQAILLLLNLFLIPIFFFYILNDYETITTNIKSLIIPKKFYKSFNNISKHINTILTGYIRGQLVIAFILALMYSSCFAIVGLKFGVLIGLITGLLSIIPYVGISLGIFFTTITLLSQPWNLTLTICIIFIFILNQVFESFILTPKFVGNKLGLNSLSTMLALIIGGNLAGVIGMLIAIPMAAIIKYLFIIALNTK